MASSRPIRFSLALMVLIFLLSMTPFVLFLTVYTVRYHRHPTKEWRSQVSEALDSVGFSPENLFEDFPWAEANGALYEVRVDAIRHLQGRDFPSTEVQYWLGQAFYQPLKTWIILDSSESAFFGYMVSSTPGSEDRYLFLIPEKESDLGFTNYWLIVAIALGIASLLIFIGHFYVWSFMLRPFHEFTDMVEAVGRTGSEALRREWRFEEFSRMADSLGTMTAALEDRERSLKQLNENLEERVLDRTKALENSLNKLRSARDQLVLADKMAALGGLVSGVTHEINTPMGISITAASFLNERGRGILKDWDNQILTEEELSRFLEDVEETSRIIMRNLEQSSKILDGLKQVAVDQQLDDFRDFELVSYVNEVLLSLKHRLKGGRHSVDIRSEGELNARGYPGALSQILTNLINNSVVHGFEGRREGRISISVDQSGPDVILGYSDNGRGLSGEEEHRIFDPYYTTKRGQGGTGLGMNIVYNLVTQKLQGTIAVRPPEDGGAGFVLRFPKTLRQRSLRENDDE